VILQIRILDAEAEVLPDGTVRQPLDVDRDSLISSLAFALAHWCARGADHPPRLEGVRDDVLPLQPGVFGCAARVDPILAPVPYQSTGETKDGKEEAEDFATQIRNYMAARHHFRPLETLDAMQELAMPGMGLGMGIGLGLAAGIGGDGDNKGAVDGYLSSTTSGWRLRSPRSSSSSSSSAT